VSRRFFIEGGWFSSPSLATKADLRGARLEAPVRGVFVLDADERGLGVWADFRGGRFLTGDSPLTPRASKTSTSAFPSEGTKMLVYVDERVSRTDIQEQAREQGKRTHPPRSRKRDLSRSWR
jgi:hypothetical protein